MRAVNLLPKEVQRASAQRPIVPTLVTVGLVAASVGLLYTMHNGAAQQLPDKQAQLDLLEGKISNAKPPPFVTPGQTVASQEEPNRITALDGALKNRMPWDSILRQISLVIPSDVTLSKMVLTAPVSSKVKVVGSTTPARGSGSVAGLLITGTTFSQDSVARLLSRLQIVPSLTNVRLTTSSVNEAATGSGSSSSGSSSSATVGVSFQIEADLRSPAVVS